MADITVDERLNLKKMMGEMDYVDNTETIRKLKHSVSIRDDIRRLEALKIEYADLRRTSPEGFFNIAHNSCRFLFDNYMDIFTRTMKDEIDFKIMSKLLIVLKLIEDGHLDQNDGSVMVGRVLKELYLDSAVRRADNIDREHEGEYIAPTGAADGRQISWREYKNTLM